MKIAGQDFYRFRKKAYLWGRGYLQSPRSNKPTNIYHATVQKTGSQWLKAVLSDPIVTKETRLSTYPQHRYEFTDFHKKFPKFTFVPGLYMSYELYEEIEKPENYRTIYILRDPRDIIVSWYYSMLKTHNLMGKVGRYRAHLKQLNYEEGIFFCIDALQIRFAQQRSWAFYTLTDPNVLTVKYEDMIQETIKEFSRIFAHCAINLKESEIHSLMDKYSFKEMKRKDLKKREGTDESHYRAGRSGGWYQALSDCHLQKFYSVTGNLVDVLGYPRS